MSTETAAGKTCAHCLRDEVVGEGTLCEACTHLPRCQVCEVFFDGLIPASTANPDRCDGCLDFEELIKFNCTLCGRQLPLYISKKSTVLHYTVRGNACGHCNAESRTAAMESSKSEERPQFIGYLAILKNFYDGGLISREQWEFAVRRNTHDVQSWQGLEIELEEDLEEVD